MLEDEASDRGPTKKPLPRAAGKRHVASEQLRLREVDDERGIDRPVQALGQREEADAMAKTIAAWVPVNQAPPASTPSKAPVPQAAAQVLFPFLNHAARMPASPAFAHKRSPAGRKPNEIIMAPRSGAGFRSGVRLAGIEPATLRSGGARSIP